MQNVTQRVFSLQKFSTGVKGRACIATLIIPLFPQICILVLEAFVGLSWAQAPGDEDAGCTMANPQVYPDTERNLMDSYNYENLLPGNGTGNSPIATAVWNDFSFDGNDAISTINPTYVSV